MSESDIIWMLQEDRPKPRELTDSEETEEFIRELENPREFVQNLDKRRTA